MTGRATKCNFIVCLQWQLKCFFNLIHLFLKLQYRTFLTYLPCVELVVWSTLGPVLGFGEAPLPRSQSPWSTPTPRLLQLHMFLSKSQNPWGGHWASISWTSSKAMSPSRVGRAFTPSTTIWNREQCNDGNFSLITITLHNLTSVC